MSRSFHGRHFLKAKYGDLYYWWRQEPKEWRRIYKHKKRRAEWRRCWDKIKQGADLENMVYPLDSRPWIYYW